MLIAFEGPIAAGKTTLATLYSEYAGGTLILEEFEENEFLADFYPRALRHLEHASQ